MQKIKSLEINEKISNLRKRDIQNFQTNYFLTPLDDEVLCLENDGAILFLQKEHDFYHLYFAIINLVGLEELFKKINTEKDIAVEVICKNKIAEDLYDCISKYFSYQTTYHRTRLQKIEPRPYNNEPEFAQLTDLFFIHNQLREEFNKYFDHFPSEQTLKEYILNNQVLVKKNHNKEILCYLIYTINNHSCHFNYMKNLSNDSFLHLSLIDQFYNEILKNGAKNVYLWVDMDNNARVRKLHEYYGHKFDGTINVAFLK